MTMVQRHIAVPTSNAPPIREWADPYWYVIRATVLQASETLSDADAELLVKAIESYKVTLPCKECRENYVIDWDANPFTLAHAKSMTAAVQWAEDIRAVTDARVLEKLAAKRALEAEAPPPPIVAPVRRGIAVPPGRRSLNLAYRQAAAVRSAAVAAAEGAPPPDHAVALSAISYRTPGVRRALTPAVDVAQRNLAMTSAVRETVANRAGPRGCNCGRR